MYAPESKEMSSPQMLPDICGLNGYLPTFSSGKAEDLFDFEAAEEFIKSGEVCCPIRSHFGIHWDIGFARYCVIRSYWRCKKGTM